MDCWAYFPSNMHIKTLFHFFFHYFFVLHTEKYVVQDSPNSVAIEHLHWNSAECQQQQMSTPKWLHLFESRYFSQIQCVQCQFFSPCIVIFSHWNHSKFKMPEYSLFEANEQIHLNLLLDSAIFLLIKKVICSNSNRMVFFPSISRIFSQSVEEAKVQNLISL